VDPELRRIAEAAKGFMPPDEGLALYEAALSTDGPLLEIGTYCGKSAVYLGAAAQERGTVLFTIDHHHGSEEMQPGWEHHDASTVDAATGAIDSYPFFRQTMASSGLDDVVIAMVGDSVTIALHWGTRLGFLFIDGAHSPEPAMADYDAWSPHLDGVLAIHDVFADPSEGGQGPYLVYRRALDDGFTEFAVQGSLRILKR
jgi:predicted O-methyltransferase YrrM